MAEKINEECEKYEMAISAERTRYMCDDQMDVI
jgi:hypothetical protein